MMQVGAGLSCKVRPGKDKTVRPLHQREVRRGWLIARVWTRAQRAQRSLCQQDPLWWLFFPTFRGL